MNVRYLLLVFIFIAGCKSSSPSSEPESTRTAATVMRHMSDSFVALIAMTLNPVAFNDPANQLVLDQGLTRLSRFTHNADAGKLKLASGRTLDSASRRFAGEMLEAKHQLQIGNRGYARFLIRGASHECISCHTQTDRGPHFLASPVNSYFEKLDALDKSDFLLATGSFDKGLSEYDKAMSDPDAASKPYAVLESATLRALAAAVRAKKDPALADALVTRVMYSKWAPVYLQMSAAKWKSDIKEWKNSRKVARTLNDAKVLISKAWTKKMESPLSRPGLIESLRASSLLHELLAQQKPGKLYAETLYYAGLNAEALKELDPFLSNEAYFEACVHHFPHSETAKNCYLRLEAARTAGYSAFESTALPPNVREDLSTLRKLAQPIEGSWLEWGKGND
jgi:hypothetical protein